MDTKKSIWTEDRLRFLFDVMMLQYNARNTVKENFAKCLDTLLTICSSDDFKPKERNYGQCVMSAVQNIMEAEEGYKWLQLATFLLDHYAQLGRTKTFLFDVIRSLPLLENERMKSFAVRVWHTFLNDVENSVEFPEDVVKKIVLAYPEILETFILNSLKDFDCSKLGALCRKSASSNETVWDILTEVLIYTKNSRVLEFIRALVPSTPDPPWDSLRRFHIYGVSVDCRCFSDRVEEELKAMSQENPDLFLKCVARNSAWLDKINSL